MMLNILNFLTETATTATNTTGTADISIGECAEGSTLFIFQIARLVIRILQIGIPFALIIWGSIDFFKAVIAGDEKEIKQKRKPFIQRLIAAILVLVLPILVNTIMKSLAKNTQSKFAECWTRADPSNGINLPDAKDDSELEY